MPQLPRTVAIWIAIVSLLLNGAVLPAHSATGPAMEICSANGARTVPESKQSPPHGKTHTACELCCASTHGADIAPANTLQVFVALLAIPNARATAAPFADSSTTKPQARAPPWLWHALGIHG
ncbi:DUF2946 family protein [Paraherbaspirillum soli]|uniref:DUF2946 family protein n=1 Tax=Paraherbaspirillum soli TaxID=631222 RepID=A0ABW0M2V5_9BURK